MHTAHTETKFVNKSGGAPVSPPPTPSTLIRPIIFLQVLSIQNCLIMSLSVMNQYNRQNNESMICLDAQNSRRIITGPEETRLV